MQNVTFNKQFLADFNFLEICFYNDDVYCIDVSQVQNFEATAQKTGSFFNNANGFFVLSKQALQTCEQSSNQQDEFAQPLGKRLLACCDVESFVLRGQNSIRFAVQYDPLTDAFGEVLEYTNCPSCHVDSEGNVVVCFGNKSQNPQRVDNNYHEIITGWNDCFENATDSFCGKFAGMSFGSSQQNGKNDLIKLCIDSDVKTKTGTKPNFCFCGVSEYFQPPWACFGGDVDLRVSKMTNGKIYVSFGDEDVQFTCDEIYVSV